MSQPLHRAGAVELGSKEARSSILAGRGLAEGKDGLKDLNKTNRKQLDVQQRQALAAEQTRDLLKGGIGLSALPI